MLTRHPRVSEFDSWVLLAAVYASDQAGHAEWRWVRLLVQTFYQLVFSHEQLRASCHRLQAVGLLAEHDGKLVPAESILELFQSKTHRRGVRDDFRELVHFLEVPAAAVWDRVVQNSYN